MTHRRALLRAFVVILCGLFLYTTTASGTVEEQRARLPPPKECSDAVEGVWMGQVYSLGQWYIFELSIRRAAPNSDLLRGQILSHFWTGGEEDEKPPACTDGVELVVKMPARGTVDASGHVEVAGTSYSVEKHICGEAVEYNLDHFEGTIDPSLQEFQSINNDGGRFVNEPTVFRRVQCFDAPRKDPPPELRAPAFAPTEHRASGCSRVL